MLYDLLTCETVDAATTDFFLLCLSKTNLFSCVKIWTDWMKSVVVRLDKYATYVYLLLLELKISTESQMKFNLSTGSVIILIGTVKEDVSRKYKNWAAVIFNFSIHFSWKNSTASVLKLTTLKHPGPIYIQNGKYLNGPWNFFAPIYI